MYHIDDLKCMLFMFSALKRKKNVMLTLTLLTVTLWLFILSYIVDCHIVVIYIVLHKILWSYITLP